MVSFKSRDLTFFPCYIRQQHMSIYVVASCESSELKKEELNLKKGWNLKLISFILNYKFICSKIYFFQTLIIIYTASYLYCASVWIHSRNLGSNFGTLNFAVRRKIYVRSKIELFKSCCVLNCLFFID